MIDCFDRQLTYLRISLTDRCNLRCRYCMPAEGVPKCTHGDILRYEEIERLVKIFAGLGVRKVRLTGGEPLVRPGAVELAARLHAIEGIEDLAITTNGVLLGKYAKALAEAGVNGVNMSLDTLREETFAHISRRPGLAGIRAGLQSAIEAGIPRIKINVVPIRGINGEDLVPLARLAEAGPIDVRYIELMPIGVAKDAGLEGISLAEVRSQLAEAFGPLQPLAHGILDGPAEIYHANGFRGRLGFIGAMEHTFCSSCNRLRLTSEGFLKLCLASPIGIDLRALLRGGADDGEIRNAILDAVQRKPRAHDFAGHGAEDSRAMYEVGG